jgi:hypothetical protein
MKYAYIDLLPMMTWQQQIYPNSFCVILKIFMLIFRSYFWLYSFKITHDKQGGPQGQGHTLEKKRLKGSTGPTIFPAGGHPPWKIPDYAPGDKERVSIPQFTSKFSIDYLLKSQQ